MPPLLTESFSSIPMATSIPLSAFLLISPYRRYGKKFPPIIGVVVGLLLGGAIVLANWLLKK